MADASKPDDFDNWFDGNLSDEYLNALRTLGQDVSTAKESFKIYNRILNELIPAERTRPQSLQFGTGLLGVVVKLCMEGTGIPMTKEHYLRFNGQLIGAVVEYCADNGDI